MLHEQSRLIHTKRLMMSKDLWVCLIYGNIEMWKRGIKISTTGFLDNDFCFLFSFLLSNPNAVMNEKKCIEFSLPIPYSPINAT